MVKVRVSGLVAVESIGQFRILWGSLHLCIDLFTNAACAFALLHVLPEKRQRNSAFFAQISRHLNKQSQYLSLPQLFWYFLDSIQLQLQKSDGFLWIPDLFLRTSFSFFHLWNYLPHRPGFFKVHHQWNILWRILQRT